MNGHQKIFANKVSHELGGATVFFLDLCSMEQLKPIFQYSQMIFQVIYCTSTAAAVEVQKLIHLKKLSQNFRL